MNEINSSTATTQPRPPTARGWQAGGRGQGPDAGGWGNDGGSWDFGGGDFGSFW